MPESNDNRGDKGMKTNTRAVINSLKIENIIIPLTDTRNLPIPGILATLDPHEHIIWLLSNHSRLLDDSFYIWQYQKQCDLPNFAWEN